MEETIMAKQWVRENFDPSSESLFSKGSQPYFDYMLDDDNLYIIFYGGTSPGLNGLTADAIAFNLNKHPEIAKRLPDPDPNNLGRQVVINITRGIASNNILIYNTSTHEIIGQVGGGPSWNSSYRHSFQLVIPIKKPEKVLKAQIRHMLEPNPRTGLVGTYQDNEADFTARINALEFLKTNWFPGGSQLTAMDNIYFVAYAIQDIFPYIFQNWNSLDPLDIFYLFHNDDLISDGQDLLIWDGKPQDFITIYNGMRDDLKKPQTHQLFTGWDKQVFILGDDNFSLENTTMGIVWDGKLMSITVEDGLKELDPQELINLFDTPPTRMAILRII